MVFGVKPNIQSVPEGVAFYRELMDKLREIAGRGIGDHHGGAARSWCVGQQRHAGGRQAARCCQRSIENGSQQRGRAGFFHTLGVPVLQGRDFLDSDTANSPHVGIINEEFAKRFLPNQNPLGHIIGPDEWPIQMTIVGVVKDHKYRSIDRSADSDGLV